MLVTLMCLRSRFMPRDLANLMSDASASSVGAVYTPSGQNPCTNTVPLIQLPRILSIKMRYLYTLQSFAACAALGPSE